MISSPTLRRRGVITGSIELDLIRFLDQQLRPLRGLLAGPGSACACLQSTAALCLLLLPPPASARVLAQFLERPEEIWSIGVCACTVHSLSHRYDDGRERERNICIIDQAVAAIAMYTYLSEVFLNNICMTACVLFSSCLLLVSLSVSKQPGSSLRACVRACNQHTHVLYVWSATR